MQAVLVAIRADGCGLFSLVLQTLAQGPCPGSGQASTPWTFRAATQQLLASLLTLNLPGSRTSSKTLIPGGVDDLLWWAQQGTNSWVLDYVVGVVYELMGMCEQEESLQASKGASAAAAAGHIVMEVIGEVGWLCNAGPVSTVIVGFWFTYTLQQAAAVHVPQCSCTLPTAFL